MLKKLLPILIFICTLSTAYSEFPTAPNKTDADGKRQGKWLMLYDASWQPTTDTLKVAFYGTCFYVDGIENGLHTDYFASGQKQMEGLYENGVQSGLMKFWEEDGTEDKIMGLLNLAQSHQQKGKYTEAEKLYEEALDISRQLYKTDHPKLVETINNTATFYQLFSDYKKAEPLLIEAFEMSKRLFKGDHPYIEATMGGLAYYYQTFGDLEKAGPLLIDCLEMSRRIYKTDHSSLAVSINNMANYYQINGDLSKAEPLRVEELGMSRRIYKTDHPNLLASISNTAYFYQFMGAFSKAEPLQSEALEMSRRLYKTDTPDLVVVTMNTGLLYQRLGDYVKAEPLFIEALEMSRRLHKTDHPQTAFCLNSLAMFYNWIYGDYVEAEPLLIESLEILRRVYKTDNHRLVLALNNIAHMFQFQDKFSKAESLYIEALEMCKRLNDFDRPELASILNLLAGLYTEQGKLSEARSLFKEVLEMRRRIYKTDNPDLAVSINNLADSYHNSSEFAKAEPLYIEALEMKRRLYKLAHSHLVVAEMALAVLYKNQGDLVKAEPLYRESVKTSKIILNKYFPSLSEKEKKKFLNTVGSSFELFNDFAVQRSAENPRILSDMYDIQLYTKALLFNSTKNIKKRIMDSKDSVLIDKYNTWSDKKRLLVKVYGMTEAERKKKNFNLDAIENSVNKLEKEISLKSEKFKQSYEKKRINWRSIQAVLQPDEAAVEIIRINKYDKKTKTDTVYYVGLIVNENTNDNPELVLLENGNMLENEYYNEYRRSIKSKIEDKNSFTRYWKSLYDKLKDYKKIYLSADGIYNKLNPATLLMPDGNYLLDVQDVQQINSTKDILLGFYRSKKESNIYNSAVLIGNPNFNLSEEKVKLADRKIRGDLEKDNDIWETLTSTRGLSLTELPGTKKEIQDIELFLKSRKWDVKSYLGDMAVKSAVKAANSPRVLHIATHGLFLEDVDLKSSKTFGFEKNTLKENPLLRSGLFFTGADNYLKSPEKKSINDVTGLLTAYEAMNLDLDKTELVVLSACETGLGQVQNGEGVFGLRRAFQTAGAKTIIMSLWAVNDKATQELMSSFYSNWVSGMSKRESFSKAQQIIKDKYKDPYYWGAFVMVGE